MKDEIPEREVKWKESTREKQSRRSGGEKGDATVKIGAKPSRKGAPKVGIWGENGNKIGCCSSP